MDNQSKKPFSSQWYAAAGTRREARRVGDRVYRFFRTRSARLPDASALRILALVVLIVASGYVVSPRTIFPVPVQVMHRSDLTTHAIPTVRPSNAVISTGAIGVAAGSENGPLSSGGRQDNPAVEPNPDTEEAVVESVEGSLLPQHRILLMYGLPGDPAQGSLASYDNLRLIEFMRERAAEFERNDPSRPVILGVEIIASLAQRTPGADGSYLRNTSSTTILSYIEFTRANDMVLFLDVQIGRRTVPADVQRLNRYLLQPHVHLAIDPQFNVAPTELPTVDPGSVTAAEIRWAQEYLVTLAQENSLPPKILIVHQFTAEMVVNKPLLRPVRGVQLVINSTLWGSPEEKARAYPRFVTDERAEFGGIMISSTGDDPAMTTEDVINLPGAPDIVIYQ